MAPCQSACRLPRTWLPSVLAELASASPKADPGRERSAVVAARGWCREPPGPGGWRLHPQLLRWGSACMVNAGEQNTLPPPPPAGPRETGAPAGGRAAAACAPLTCGSESCLRGLAASPSLENLCYLKKLTPNNKVFILLPFPLFSTHFLDLWFSTGVILPPRTHVAMSQLGGSCTGL